MADAGGAKAAIWAVAGALLVLLLMSFIGNGTAMGGMGMGWMMGGGVLLLLAAVYFAYRFGRLEEKVEGAKRPRP